MKIDNYEWRPITVQGVTFPATVMGISVLGAVLRTADEELGNWLWRLRVCCGFTKSAPAEQCARCARQAAALMLDHRAQVLDGIRENLSEYGFDPETTYRDWLLALQRIAELSAAAEGDCHWSAPVHPRDTFKSEDDVLHFLDNVSNHESGNP